MTASLHALTTSEAREIPGSDTREILSAALALLDSFAAGVLIVHGDGSVLWANREGERLYAELDLEWVLGRFVQTASQSRIVRHGSDALMLNSIPLGRSADGEAVLFAVIVRRFCEDEGAPSSETLEAIFGLTPAEARVALAICSGHTISEIAERLGVADSTIRSQLKSVFGKSGCHRQAELVRQIRSLRSVPLQAEE